MSADLVMVQESVKLALDDADAAADVTAEYNKVKKRKQKISGTGELDPPHVGPYCHYCRRCDNRRIGFDADDTFSVNVIA